MPVLGQWKQRLLLENSLAVQVIGYTVFEADIQDRGFDNSLGQGELLFHLAALVAGDFTQFVPGLAEIFTYLDIEWVLLLEFFTADGHLTVLEHSRPGIVGAWLPFFRNTKGFAGDENIGSLKVICPGKLIDADFVFPGELIDRITGLDGDDCLAHRCRSSLSRSWQCSRQDSDRHQ
jgi:hypothetical protein